MNDPFCHFERAIAATDFSNFFVEEDLQQGDIIVTNYDTSLFPGMYIL